MVEPVSLTLGGLAALLIAKATDAAADGAVRGTGDALRRGVGRLRDRLDEDDNPTTSRAVSEAEKSPSEPALRRLATLLDERCERDPVFRQELERIVEAARADGLVLPAASQVASGDHNVQIQRADEAEIHISYGADPPRSE